MEDATAPSTLLHVAYTSRFPQATTFSSEKKKKHTKRPLPSPSPSEGSPWALQNFLHECQLFCDFDYSEWSISPPLAFSSS